MKQERWWQRVRARLARVTVAPVGGAADGLTPLRSAGAGLDRPWQDLLQEFTDAREAWRVNPLARRLIGLVTSFVVGDGLALTADEGELSAFLAQFWHDEQNALGLRQYAWCEELARAGELFITLHLNPANGMSYVRGLPASSIDRIEHAAGDYERELAYHEMPGPADAPEGRWWLAPGHPAADAALADGRLPPVCLHFAVNRPIGCLRGESDLAPVLPWLRRYSRWLEDRVRLNAAIHAFLWVVKVPGRLVAAKTAALLHPPEPGSVLVMDRDNEEWQAVAPGLHANDASADGRAIRWMVVAGGPGVGLVDLGEAEEANLATAQAMGEQRSRFMRARQAYFGFVLAEVALTAYNRAVRLGLWRGAGGALLPPATRGAIRVAAPDISPADNRELGASAQQVAEALRGLTDLGLAGPAWRRLALRLVLKFAGENVDDAELTAILADADGERR